MNPDPVVLINAFEVPDGQHEAFLEGWERARAVLVTQPGYISTRLHRSPFRMRHAAVLGWCGGLVSPGASSPGWQQRSQDAW